MTTQTASQTTGADAANPANAGSAATAAGPAEAATLDKLLKEFENSQTQPKAIDVLKAVEPVINYVNGEMTERENKVLEADISGAVKSVKAELKLSDEYPDRLIRGALRDLAAENPEFAKAWEQRRQSPGDWSAKLKSDAVPVLKAEIEKARGKDIRSDIDAAQAAVRNVSTSPQNGAEMPSPTEMFQMNDRQWSNFKAKLRAGG